MTGRSHPNSPEGRAPAEMGEDGGFAFIGISDGTAKRYHVTPGSDTSLASFLASAPSLADRASRLTT